MRAGFVLAGGLSSRMGEAPGNVTAIGSPDRHAFLGLPIIPDAVESRGPLSGVYTALNASTADWYLIVACDNPSLTAEFLRGLLAAAEQSGKDSLVPVTPRGFEPLCAVYHARIRSVACRTLHANLLKNAGFRAFARFRRMARLRPGYPEDVATPSDLNHARL